MQLIHSTKKEAGLTAITCCLALASLAPADPYVGIAMLTLSWIGFVYLAYYHQGSRSQRAVFVMIVTLIIAFIGYRMTDFSKITKHPYRLKIWAKTIPGKYPQNTILAGIPWEPEYVESRLYLYNDSPLPYKDVDLLISSNQTIVKLGQLTNFPNVFIAPAGLADHYEFIFKDANGNKILPTETTSSSYRIHCAEVISHTTIGIVLAVKPWRPPASMHVEGSYQIDNQRYAITNTENFKMPSPAREFVPRN